MAIVARSAAVLVCGFPFVNAIAASFTPLGDLPAGPTYSIAYDISADGAVIVGESRSGNGIEAFRWTANGGMLGLGDLPGGSFSSVARGVSADGSVVVGVSHPEMGSAAFRWTSAEGMIGLGNLTGELVGHSDAYAVSADGSVIVGESHTESGTQAFRWTSTPGMIGLGFLPSGGLQDDSSWANDVSADGLTVVGFSTPSMLDGYEAFRWTSTGAMVGLGDLPGGDFGSVALGVSPDGSVVVGRGQSTIGYEAFRWTSADGMVGLGHLPNLGFHSVAHAVSADGSVVVGSSGSGAGFEAFVWTEGLGLQQLFDVLVANGATGVEGWNLISATGISADGRWVIGGGINPSGYTEAFLADISLAPVPVPSAVWLLGPALGILVWVRRRAVR